MTSIASHHDTSAIASTADARAAALADPLVRRVRDYADNILRPSALRTDREGVTRGRIAELARLGLLNHLAPVRFGGQDIGRDVDRYLHEIVSGACFNTWVVWAQHGPLTGRIARHAGDVPVLFEQVLRGQVLLGAGVSDVRRYPGNTPLARRVDGGWIFSGTISWVSGWGLSTALTVSAVEPVGEVVVTALVTVGERTLAQPLDLAAVGGSRTERVRLDDVFVPDQHVIEQQSLAQWRFNDLGIASDARPHHFGLAETVLGELERSEQEEVRQVAVTWRPRVQAIRERAYALADEAAAHIPGTSSTIGVAHRIDERRATKVASGEALSTITRALLISRSGRGLAGDDTAQLHARSALFVLVQGQTADVRRAQLELLAR